LVNRVYLAAVASTDASGGLFYPSSPLLRVPCDVRIGNGGNVEWARTEYTPGIESSKDIPLLSRAWVFQETLLPSRVLLFAKHELFWECDETHGTGTYPEAGASRRIGVDQVEDATIASFRKDWREIHRKDSLSRIELWNEAISKYSEKKLKNFSDKLVAIAGLAFDMGKDWPAVDYIAGLWSYQLSDALLWEPGSSIIRPSTIRPRIYVAPSWSWASVDGPVFYRRRDCSDALVEVIDTNIEYSTPSKPYGPIASGYIRVRGPLFEAKIAKTPGSYNGWNISLFDKYTPSALRVLPPYCRTNVNARIYWDDAGFSSIIEAGDVFMMPFRVFRDTGAGFLTLEGLVLSRTFLRNGQFQRIGLFQIQDGPSLEGRSILLSANAETDQQYLSANENVSDRSLSPDTGGRTEDLNIDGCSQDRPFNSRGDWYFTQYFIGEILRWVVPYPSPPEIHPLSKRSNAADGHLNRDLSGRGDKYENGVINTTLLERYRHQLGGDQYSNINSCLTYKVTSSYSTRWT
jgi:hypothetical protein